MREYLKIFTKITKKHRKVTIVIILIAVFATSFLTAYFIGNTNSQLEITPYSSVTRDTGRTVFSINTTNKYLYKSNKKGLDAAKEFLEKNPSIGNSGPLFPEGFLQNATTTRQIEDKNDSYLQKNGISINNEHYFFDQSLNGVPIYKASAVVHIKNGNEVYSTSGNVSSAKDVTSQIIQETKAVQIAFDLAKNESRTSQLEIEETKKIYINEQLLGISDNPKNQIALKVMIRSKGSPIIFRTEYIISLSDGKLLYSESQTRDLLNRNVYNCNGSTTCSKARSEGSPSSGDAEADNLYSYFYTVYDYFKLNYGRDSYDNSGAPYNGYVHVPANSGGGSAPANSCPNAQWNGREMVFCTGLVTLDVTGHELAHALTGSTAGLIYSNESGALNEAVSDIFGSVMDNNWTMGEGIPASAGLPVPLRSMSNPPSRNQPDKLSSYTCGPADKGGVHSNSGIINKAFYLMTDGGSFNGCTMSGIGRIKSHPIIYMALTKYLSPTSNFKEAYTTFLQACNDIYGSSSSECDNVNRAMQATLIDQQPQGSSSSPTCSGATLQPATCATSGSPSPNPTSSITPTVTTNPTPGGSNPGGGSTPGVIINEIIGTVYTDSNSNSVFDPGESGFSGAQITLSGALNTSATTDSSGNFAFHNVPSGGYTIVARVAGAIVGQGTFTIPSSSSTTMKLFIALNPLQTTPTPVILQPTVITPTPTPTLVPTTTTVPGGSGKFEPLGTPTPTPEQYYTCVPDPACVASGKKIQLCPLKCTPQ